MKKIIAVGITAMMLLVSFSMILPDVVIAEEITGPFAEKSNGYPADDSVIQQSQEVIDNTYQFGANSYLTQTFTPSVDDFLTKLSIFTASPSGGGTMQVQITTTVDVGGDVWWPDQPIPGASETIDGATVPNGDWLDIEFSSPPDLSSGVKYAIFIGTSSFDFYWGYATSDVYPGGVGWNGDPTPIAIGGDFNFRTYTGGGDSGIKKIAWHESGDYAIGVTGFDNTIWKYDRNTGDWTNPHTTGAGDAHKDIVYDDFYDVFYVAGREGTNSLPWVYEYTIGGGFANIGGLGEEGTYYGIEACGGISTFRFFAVGQKDTGQPIASWFHGGWTHVINGLDTVGDALYDVTWDERATGRFYAVGENVDSAIAYSFETIGLDTGTRISDAWNGMGAISAIDWCPDFGNYNYSIMVGGNGITGNVWTFDGTNAPVNITLNSSHYPRDIDWRPDEPYAAIVGGDEGSNGILYHYHPDTGLVDNSNSLPGGTDAFKGVAYKAPSSPSSALIVGGGGAMGFFPSAIDGSTRINANAVFPHLYWIGFNDTAGTSRMDQQVPVNSWYNFTGVFNYSQGYDNCEVIVQAWYDWGLAGVGSTYPAEIDSNRNLAFEIVYDIDTDTLTQNYPGALEVYTGTGADSLWSAIDGVQDHWFFELPVYFGAQIRNASGSGFLSGDADYDVDPNNALQDTGSWDFNITVRDDTGNPTAFDKLYGEFGVDKTVSVSVAGNPAGNAPPGSSNVLLSNPSQITYSSNADYWVNVSIPNLLENGVGPASILATFVEVQNIDPYAAPANSGISAQTSIAGAGTDMYVWGVAGTPLPAPSNGTIACGEWVTDYNAAGFGLDDFTILNWWITVPGATPEGVYWATITITIES